MRWFRLKYQDQKWSLDTEHVRREVSDAQPDDGFGMTPIYDTDSHLHVNRKGNLVGAHVWANTQEEAVDIAKDLVNKLILHFAETIRPEA